VSTRSHELHLLTGGYALDALPDEERAEFERHLARCSSCAEEVKGMRETAARLALATAVVPPPELRERVLAAVPRTRQLPPAGFRLLARPGKGTRARRARGRRLPLTRAGLTAGVLAVVAAIAFLVVTQVSTSHQLDQSQAANRSIAAVLAAPDARIESAQATVGGTVTAVMSSSEHEAVVTTTGIPSLPEAQVYQLWVMTAAGTATPAGLLEVTSSGSAVPVLAADVQPGDRLGITVEPAGGTKQPTTTPIVTMPVSD
jgi:anti-sigma-K factor RskA